MISGGGRRGCCPDGPQAGYNGVAFGPDLELLAGRQGQLRRRPGGGRQGGRDAAEHRGPGPGGRAFLGRAIRYLAGEAGVRQFLDIGTGLPTAENTHEVAQRVAPEARIVYADNDPLVLLHARALLTSSPEGVCDYIDGDLREPDKILDQAARALDFTRPVALMLLGILHRIPDTDLAYSIVRRLTAALAPGSFLAINHSTSAVHGAAMEEAVAHWNQVGTPSMTLRSPQQIARFFDGLDLLEPGVVSCSRWRPALSPVGGQPAEVDEFCGVARKP